MNHTDDAHEVAGGWDGWVGMVVVTAFYMLSALRQQPALIRTFFQHSPTDTGNGLSVFETTETGSVI